MSVRDGLMEDPADAEGEVTVWITLIDRKYQLGPDDTFEVLSSGVLRVIRAHGGQMYYAPHAWSQVKVSDPVAVAASILMGDDGVPDSPSGLG